MYLKRLEVQGFKTFAARTVFEFNPGTTAVVGPNGSGKSNMADLLRWVLGEQSYAALRCKRTEDLIYAGGGKRPPAGLAEATLTIDNSDRLLPLAFDEVTITRRATRAGENEYLVNKARVRLRDVQELAALLGGAYAIINQGMVDAALTLRAEDRRRLFEEAAGIAGFEARQQEAERRLRETDGNLSRVADLLAELEPQLRSLKRQAGQARAHRELTHELLGLLSRHYRVLWQAAQRGRAAADAELAWAADTLAQAQARHAQLAAELQARRAELRGRREGLGALHQESAQLHQRAEAVQRALAIGAEQLAALAARAAEAEREQQELEARRAAASQELEARQAAQREAEGRLTERRAALAEAERDDGTLAARRIAQQAVDEAQRALLAATGRGAEARSRAEQVAARRERLRAEEPQAQAQSEQLARALELALAAQREAEDLLAAIEQALRQAQQEQRDLSAASDDARRRRAEADEALAVARRTLADGEARYESLERLRRSHSGAFQGVRAALEWAERSGRGGFALVSSVVETPAELETAVEVALGSRLQNIIVEAWQDAEEAIGQLKRANAGRATFLPLDTLRPPRPASPPPSPGILGIACDLVRYDAHYERALRQLLGRVLIAEDLPAARRALRDLEGGWTIVTLGGEQVSSGGAVTGGAQTRDTGTLRRERELRELPAQIEAYRRELARLDGLRAQAQEQLQAQEQRGRELRGTLREREEQRARRRDAADAAARRARQAEQEHEWRAAKRAEERQELELLEAQERELAAASAGAAAAIAEAEGALAAARERLDVAQAADAERARRIGEFRAALAGAEAEARAIRAACEQERQALARLDAQAAQARERRAAAEDERAALVHTSGEAEARHAALVAAIQSLQAQIAPAEEAIAAAEDRLASLEQQETAAGQALREYEARQSRATLEAERARDRLDLLWERAATDDIDIEALVAGELPPTAAGDAEGEAQQEQSALDTQIAQVRGRLQRMGPVNPLALDEYEAAAERHGFLGSQSEDLRSAAASLRELIAELQATMEARFALTFEAVAKEFEQTFAQLFGGGAAQLLITRERDEHHAEGENGVEHLNGNGRGPGKITGVEILARPPGKKQQPLSLLSGGERSLTAVALLFAILRVNPSPFCVLDEVDAALDEANVGRFRDALGALAERTQFVVITHNRSTIEAADTLYGISMLDDGSSKVLSLRLEEVEA
jgi:chromosome segregation protein